ncbi:hypothetical protein E2C01_045201 [Portunus trituberculatus]|uniref:Uncharacterized protein n=1 Tax=Portunus trituberculatus TaxID=210409 RepID=A0A5B7G164_PORTR|nr:hypothetical protein [Portunus trituberculatus]
MRLLHVASQSHLAPPRMSPDPLVMLRDRDLLPLPCVPRLGSELGGGEKRLSAVYLAPASQSLAHDQHTYHASTLIASKDSTPSPSLSDIPTTLSFGFGCGVIVKAAQDNNAPQHSLATGVRVAPQT